MRDFSKFPATAGIILFPISMSRISNRQNAKNCFRDIEHLVQKVKKPHVGLNFIYSDFLYLNSEEKAANLKS